LIGKLASANRKYKPPTNNFFTLSNHSMPLYPWRGAGWEPNRTVSYEPPVLAIGVGPLLSLIHVSVARSKRHTSPGAGDACPPIEAIMRESPVKAAEPHAYISSAQPGYLVPGISVQPGDNVERLTGTLAEAGFVVVDTMTPAKRKARERNA